MKYCKNCDVKYQAKIENCLLCQNHLDNISSDIEVSNFTEYKKIKDTNIIIKKTVFLINLVSIILSLFIDLSINKQISSWSIIVVISNIYLILLFNSILSKTRTFYKIVTLLVLTTMLVVGIGFSLNDYHWAIDIFLPFALILNTLTITIIILARPRKWRDYISFLFISIIMNLLSLLLNIFKVTNITWAITACFFYGIVTLLSFLIFTPKDLKDEILRRFHV